MTVAQVMGIMKMRITKRTDGALAMGDPGVLRINA